MYPRGAKYLTGQTVGSTNRRRADPSWFVGDSPLEGTGFEPSVPGKSDEAFRTASARPGVRSVSGCSRYRFLSGACSGRSSFPSIVSCLVDPEAWTETGQT
jgi:hypothetical protein